MELNFNNKSPGKIIISGEHAVVYDSKALACAINLFTKCNIKIENTNYGEVFLNLVNLNKKFHFYFDDLNYIKEYVEIIKNLNNDNDFINKDINDFLKLIKEKNDKNDNNDIHFIYLFNLIISYIILKLQLEVEESFEKIKFFIITNGINITVSSDIPHNAGLGSSAAYNVSLTSCIIDLLIHILSIKITTDENTNFLLILSFNGEKYFHSKPSGIDNVTSVLGGIILFENFNNYTNIETNFFNDVKFYLIDTTKRRDTKTFIKKVNEFKNNFNNIFKNSIESINYIVEDILDNMSKNGDFEKFAKFIEINQYLLQIIQVSTEEIDTIVNVLKHNQIASKLTGAGGGGFVLTFVRQDEENKFLELAEKNNFKYTQCMIKK